MWNTNRGHVIPPPTSRRPNPCVQFTSMLWLCVSKEKMEVGGDKYSLSCMLLHTGPHCWLENYVGPEDTFSGFHFFLFNCTWKSEAVASKLKIRKFQVIGSSEKHWEIWQLATLGPDFCTEVTHCSPLWTGHWTPTTPCRLLCWLSWFISAWLLETYDFRVTCSWNLACSIYECRYACTNAHMHGYVCFMNISWAHTTCQALW